MSYLTCMSLNLSQKGLLPCKFYNINIAGLGLSSEFSGFLFSFHCFCISYGLYADCVHHFEAQVCA
jgi:hypothetical protein